MKKLFLMLIFGISVLFGKVDINSADKNTLMSLTGIGQVTADRIIQYRDANCFSAIDEIKRVKGIGEGKFSKLKELIEAKPCKEK